MGTIAVVTGASSGIGAATARWLAAAGFTVWALARRGDRLEALAEEVGVRPFVVDVTSDDSVAAFAAAVPEVDVLVNNAGLALGMDPVVRADTGDWRRMYEVNVLGSMRMTRALLPALARAGGHVVMMTSTAAREPYEGGAGYNAAKAAQSAMTRVLRLELNGTPVRVTEVAPGLVRTEEFSVVRFGGDAERAAAVYEGVPEPLTAEDVAEVVGWAVTRPAHVNIDLVTLRPVAQAAYHKMHRGPLVTKKSPDR